MELNKWQVIEKLIMAIHLKKTPLLIYISDEIPSKEVHFKN
ncbi:hypothetical protein NEF87_001761 [Candidatus Lokiarchaeum ossiferum]|uniref:Uncharacterized protein n=1 Tax=Candidatus Lokiarchaeum ossiferum TaxID=2951803 RepID=A0ABY6HPM8_9ARCH|nr:hypothetical protein NEF87_001761 [Candidatus Lokiarchaeum sp. B-35]